MNESAPNLRERTSLRMVATGAALLSVVGIVSACDPTGQHDSPAPHSTSRHIENPTPQLAPVSAAVRTAIDKAMSVDTCVTKVTAADVTSTYQRLFGYQLPSKDSLDGLNTLVKSEIRQLQQSRTDRNYVQLPNDFKKLEDDALTDKDAVPVTEYQTSFDAYMQQFGVTSLYNWRKQDISILTAQGTIYPIKPLSSASLASNRAIRRDIVGEMISFANLSPELIKANISRIAFGDITATAAPTLGEALTNDKTMLIDVADPAKFPKSELPYIQDQLDSLAEHELTHHVTERFCPVIFGPQIDPAYASFNGSFTYGSPLSGQDISLKSDQGDLITKKGTVVVAKPYGGELLIEDEATLFGEEVLHTPNIADIYDSKGDTTPIKEKIALLMARVAKTEPKVGQFYELQFAATRTLKVVLQRLAGLDKKYSAAFSASSNSDPTKDPAVKAIQDAEDPYLTLRTQLMAGISGVPQ